MEILSLRDIGLEIEIEEFGNTLLENALIKARTIHYITKIPTLSDDSGLFICALEGFPGVESAKFQRQNPDYLQKILKMMENKNNRTSYFRCVLIFIDESGNEFVFEGEVEGEISYEIRGYKGFGYDPIFYYKPLNKTFAEIDLQTKNQISHRAIALGKFKNFLLSRKI